MSDKTLAEAAAELAAALREFRLAWLRAYGFVEQKDGSWKHPGLERLAERLRRAQ